MLYKGLNELLAQASQAMAMLSGETKLLALGGELFSFHWQEVEVRREGTQKVQDVMAPIIANDTLTLHRGAKLYRGVFLVEHSMPLHLQGAAGLLQKLQILGMGHYGLAEVNGAIDDTLLLLPLQDARNDGLSSYTVTSVVHHHRSQGVEPLHIHSTVCPHPVQVIGGGSMGGSVPAQLPVVVAYIKSQAEENVVPDEHLHTRLFSRIDRHDVAINHRHRTTRRRSSKVTMNLRNRSAFVS